MNTGALPGRAPRRRSRDGGEETTALSLTDQDQLQDPAGDDQHAPAFPTESTRRRPPLGEGSAPAGGHHSHRHGGHHTHRNHSAGIASQTKSAAAAGLAAASQLLQFDERAPIRLALVLGVLFTLIAFYFCCKRCSRAARRRRERHDDVVYQPLSIKEFESAQISDLDSDDDKVEFRQGRRNRK